MERRSLLLLLLCSVSPPIRCCNTGVAYKESLLSVEKSLLDNADVALLHEYNASRVEQCMQDCCTGKYGLCSIASFKTNTTRENCLHFNCRPLRHCKFVSSNFTTSFTFSSNPFATQRPPVLSNLQNSSSSAGTTEKEISVMPNTTAKNGSRPVTKEEIATYSEEQFAFKNDNTTIKPRKGVDDFLPDDLLTKSVIKPRKGVSFDDVPHSNLLLNSLGKSNVKPRKGVELYSSRSEVPELIPTSHTAVPEAVSFPHTAVPDSESFPPIAVSKIPSKPSSLQTFPASTDFQNVSKSLNYTESLSSSELISVLEKVFEDDSEATTFESTIATLNTESSIRSNTGAVTPNFPAATKHQPSAPHFTTQFPSVNTTVVLSNSDAVSTNSDVSASSETSTFHLKSTYPYEQRPVAKQTESTTVLPSATGSASVILLSKPSELFEDSDGSVEQFPVSEDEQEVTNEKKYKSSMHLVLSLVFGLLVLFVVLGVVARRVYDSWIRRDYYRMNYLIDGIYNGVD